MATRAITLSYPHITRDSDDAYRVEQVEGTVDFVPGEFLAKVRVRDICELGMIKVTMKRNTDKR